MKPADFHYECHKCKTNIPGFYDNLKYDQVKMIREKKNSPNWLFECFQCFNQITTS